MNPLVTALLTFLITTLCLYPVRMLALRYGVVDRPGGRRTHAVTTPRLGGIAIFISLFVMFLMLGSFSSYAIWFMLALTLVFITGLADDILGLSPRTKLAGQFIAATVIIFFCGISFEFWFDTPGSFLMYLLSVIITYVWIIGVTNAVNLIDGMDGLAGGISAIALGALGVTAHLKGYPNYSLIAFAAMGSTLGFLKHNTPPAKIFMGDSGSLLLGFIIAIVSLHTSFKSGTILSIMIPFFFIAIPVLDTMFAIIRRILTGRHPFSPDRGHLHHKLVDLGFTVQQALFIFYALTAILAFTGMQGMQRSTAWGLIAVLLVLLGALAMVRMFAWERFSVNVIKGNKRFHQWVNGLFSIPPAKRTVRTSLPGVAVEFFTLAAVISGIVAFKPVSAGDWFITLCAALAIIWLAFSRFARRVQPFAPFVLFCLLFAGLWEGTNAYGYYPYTLGALAVMLLFLMDVLRAGRLCFVDMLHVDTLAFFAAWVWWMYSGADLTRGLFVFILSLLFHFSNRRFYLCRKP